MGHAVYTLSDPRAVILKRHARSFAEKCGCTDDFRTLELIEQLTPELFSKYKGKEKICANVDLYSGLIYDMLHIPQELFTPLFMSARIAGWSAHRIEELTTGSRIMRPAYKMYLCRGTLCPSANVWTITKSRRNTSRPKKDNFLK